MTDRAKGIFWIVTSAFGFALMAALVRLTDDFGTPVSAVQKAFFRNLLASIIAGAVLFRQGCSRAALPPKEAWSPLIWRCVFGSVGIFANFYALGLIPIGEAMMLNKTAPFFTLLFSWLFLNERVALRQIAFIVLAFAGAALIVKPGANAFGSLAAGLGLVGGLGAGAAYALVRKLGVMKVNSAFIVFFFSIFSTLLSVPFIAVAPDAMNFAQVAIMLLAGASAAVGQFGITLAYRHQPARSIAVYDYTNVVFAALLGLGFFGQLPDVWSVAGFVVILAAAIGIGNCAGDK